MKGAKTWRGKGWKKSPNEGNGLNGETKRTGKMRTGGGMRQAA